MFVFEPGASLNAIVEAVNQVGAAPGDLVAILEALQADLETISRNLKINFPNSKFLTGKVGAAAPWWQVWNW